MSERVGEKARVILTSGQDYDHDALLGQMNERARAAFVRMMEADAVTPTSMELVWVKPVTEVEPELLGDIAAAKDIHIWMYEATAA